MPSAFSFVESVDRCDLCNGRHLQVIALDANVTECADCGYRFVSPRPCQQEIAAAYSDPHFYDQWVAAGSGRVAMWRKRLWEVRRAARGTRLLDIGAGIGTFLALARDSAGWTVTGTEVSIAAELIARERYGINLLHGQPDTLPLPTNAFDVVTLWHVLEHLPFPSRALQVCHDVLVPGGCLVLAVPNDADSSLLPSRFKRLLLQACGRQLRPQPRYQPLSPGLEIHLSHFTPQVLRRFLNKAGFRVRRMTVDDHHPQPNLRTDLTVSAYRAIMRLTGHNLGPTILVIAQSI